MHEEKYNTSASQAEEVYLYGQVPPIQKLDASINTLVNCKKLSLSTNAIDKISNLSSLRMCSYLQAFTQKLAERIEILSIGRNNIKSLAPLDVIANTLQQLWISYNQIEKLTGITTLKKLRVLCILYVTFYKQHNGQILLDTLRYFQ